MMVDSSFYQLSIHTLTLLFESLGSAAYILKEINTFIQKGKSKETKVEITCMH